MADFDGDGVVDIVSFSSNADLGDCYLATVHWCQLRDRSLTVIGEAPCWWILIVQCLL